MLTKNVVLVQFKDEVIVDCGIVAAIGSYDHTF